MAKRLCGILDGFEPFIRSYLLLQEYEFIKDPQNRVPDYDKFFHCPANCQATKLGEGGEFAAKLISEMRENLDQYGPKKDPLENCNEDREANEKGREAGKNDKPCTESCFQYLLQISK